jgi:hypothetical protein
MVSTVGVAQVSPTGVAYHAKKLAVTSISPVGVAFHNKQLSITAISPVGVAVHAKKIAITQIAPIGVAHHTRSLAVTRIWVQTGDYPFVENVTRYRRGGQWIPPTAEWVRVGGAWLEVL